MQPSTQKFVESLLPQILRGKTKTSKQRFCCNFFLFGREKTTSLSLLSFSLVLQPYRSAAPDATKLRNSEPSQKKFGRYADNLFQVPFRLSLPSLIQFPSFIQPTFQRFQAGKTRRLCTRCYVLLRLLSLGVHLRLLQVGIEMMDRCTARQIREDMQLSKVTNGTTRKRPQNLTGMLT